MFNRIVLSLIIILGLICSSLMILIYKDREAAALAQGGINTLSDQIEVTIEAETTGLPKSPESPKSSQSLIGAPRKGDNFFEVVKGNSETIDSNLDAINYSAELIELTDDVGQTYFVNYRIKREQFRQETKEMLKLLLESDIRQTREEAQTRWLALSNKISKEGEIENVLKMRGFKDVVSEVNAVKATVIILASELTLQEKYQVQSIIADITGFAIDRIEVRSRV